MSFFSELQRRNIPRIASAYAVAAWLLLQVASIVLPIFAAPEWVMQGITVLLVVGFPITILLTWIFDITAQGIVRDEGTGEMPSQSLISARTLDMTIIGILLIAVSLFAYDEFVIEEREAATPGRRPAVAVLPFETQEDDANARMFADGLATELIARLASWPSFTVISRSASFSSTLEQDIFAAGEKLDARYFVNGSIRTIEDRIRIDISVTDTTDGQTIWNQNFERQRDGILQLEDEMGRAIVGQISPALLSRESERAMRANPDNLDAWEAAHRGWWHLNTETEEGYNEANEWFDRAIELDANWGWPYAAKGLAIYRSFLNGWSSRTDEAKNKMMEYASHAVQVDPMDAFAHHALGHAYGVVNRRDESIMALARGVQLNPNDAMAQACYGMQLAAAKRPQEAIDAINTAMSLSPEDPWLHWYTLVLARAYFGAGDYENSELWALRSNQLKPGFPAKLHSVSAAAHVGKIDVARQRVIDWRATGRLPPVDALEANFLTHTEEEYTTRLMDGLRMADFDTAGVVEEPSP